MKFGVRKPNFKSSLKARTTGKAKRAVKRAVIPGYGRKGMGFARNPKKSVYNAIYRRTTVDAFKDLKTPSTLNNSTNNRRQYSSTETMVSVNEVRNPTVTRIILVFAGFLMAAALLSWMGLIKSLPVSPFLLFIVSIVFFFVAFARLSSSNARKAQIAHNASVQQAIDKRTKEEHDRRARLQKQIEEKRQLDELNSKKRKMAALIKWLNGKTLITNDTNLPSSFSRFNRTELINLQKESVDAGLLVVADLHTTLVRMTVTSLRAAARDYELQIQGNKEAYINNLIDNLTVDQAEELRANAGIYVLSTAGANFIEESKGVKR